MAYTPIYNLDDNSFIKNRLLYHAASRVGIQTGQSMAQATTIDGHTITSGKVWTAAEKDFVVHTTEDMKTTTNGIAATNDLVAKFLEGAVAKKTLNNGTVYTNALYPAVELYYQVQMTGVKDSNASGSKYEAYQILDGGNRVQDWIPPVAVKDAGRAVPGYTGRIEVYKNQTWKDLQDCSDVEGAWAASNCNWEFVYLSGMVIFHPQHTPVGHSYTGIRFTGFHYIGKMLDATLKEINDAIASIGDIEGGSIAEALATKVNVTVYNKKMEDLQKADSDLSDAIATKVTAAEVSDAIDAKLVDYYTGTQIDAKIKAQVASAAKYIGKVADYTELPTGLTAANHGNIYHVTTKDGVTVNTEYIWTQLSSDSQGYWQQIGGIIDLSDYYTTEATDEAIKTAVDAQKDRATKEEKRIEDKLDQQILDRKASDSAIREQIAGISQAQASNSATIAQQILDRKASDSAIRGELTQAIRVSRQAQKDNADDIIAEKDRAVQKEGQIAKSVTDQKERAVLAEQALAGDISDATERITTAEGQIDALQGAIEGYTAQNNIATAIAAAKTATLEAAQSDATTKADAAQQAAITQAGVLAGNAETAAKSYADEEIKKVTDSLVNAVYFEQII